MAEEYHADSKGLKQLFGWEPLNTNVWLISYRELYGIRGAENEAFGTYQSAMQGIDLATAFYVDGRGGSQFAYFAQYNASGGGELIWNLCSRQTSWVRSTMRDVANAAYMVNGSSNVQAWSGVSMNAWAVHPAVLYNPRKNKDQGDHDDRCKIVYQKG